MAVDEGPQIVSREQRKRLGERLGYALEDWLDDLLGSGNAISPTRRRRR